MNIDPTKPVRTRDGQPVRILCTDRKSNQPIIGLVGPEEEYLCTWYADGRQTHRDSGLNLVQDEIRYMNAYPASGYATLEEALRVKTENSLVTIKVTLVDGVPTHAEMVTG